MLLKQRGTAHLQLKERSRMLDTTAAIYSRLFEYSSEDSCRGAKGGAAGCGGVHGPGRRLC